MAWIIGIDEAGYGPNLGPLVVTATVWKVNGLPQQVDLWNVFARSISHGATTDRNRIQIADSKQVYSPARGIAALERSVLTALALIADFPLSFGELWTFLTQSPANQLEVEPWFQGRDLALPRCVTASQIEETAAACQADGARSGVQLHAVRTDVVLTQRFNELVDHFGSKGVALSTISLQLLASVWDHTDGQPALVIADKHGGRNRYDELLGEALGNPLVFRLQESRDISRYRIGNSEVRFEAKGEKHLPVALASLVSKYTRELAMDLFNAFWREHLPDLKPTKGYPTDARRFRADISARQHELGIADEVLWRTR